MLECMSTPETAPEPEQDHATRLTSQPNEPAIVFGGLRIASGHFRARGPVKPERPAELKDYGETTGA
jgi:hypothetical protein